MIVGFLVYKDDQGGAERVARVEIGKALSKGSGQNSEKVRHFLFRLYLSFSFPEL